jgi:8-oxo-dGTP pyrophosphatase MutT (NUDIX family)
VNALAIVAGFNPGPDDLARKSQELALGLLVNTPEPFSRRQFNPGHITCTALVMHPDEPKVLFMHHHRLRRWLLPGGHVETSDASLPDAAAREALEETHVQIDGAVIPYLAGVDVHGIPPKGDEPFHLHHDLIWCFRSLKAEIAVSSEAPSVMWAGNADWDWLGVAESIRRSILRTGQ